MTKLKTVENPHRDLYQNEVYRNMKVGDCVRIIVSGDLVENRYSLITKENCELFLIRDRHQTRMFTKTPRSQVNSEGLYTETSYGLWKYMEEVAKEPIVFLNPSVKNITKLKYEDKLKVTDFFDIDRLPKKRGAKNELGSELELEGSNTDWPKKFIHIMSSNNLVDNVGTDGSVAKKGTEIRFAHPELPGWNLSAIRCIMRLAKENGFGAGPTAGQHVHISHPKILKALFKFEFNLDLMNEFFKPISCRQTARYGLNNDLYRNQYSEFGTLEIRCWESTTNPVLFRKRIVFAKMFVDYLISDEPIEKIWTKMPIKMAKLYVDMLFTENPHSFGGDPKDVLKKLSGWARKYAKRTYNEGE